jgi:CRISPR-associated endoribonuclease Cas6
MPFSLVVHSVPQTDAPVTHVQGRVLHALFLHLIDQIDPALAERLHEQNQFRPFTLSPLAASQDVERSHTAWMPPRRMLPLGTLTLFRMTFLDDTLFPAFSQSIFTLRTPDIRLGGTMFTITDIVTSARRSKNRWSRFVSYPDLIKQASRTRRNIPLRFLSPTTFGFGDSDLPLPLPRLVFQSYQRRFQEFSGVVFPPDFAEQVERYTVIKHFHHLATHTILVGKTEMIGFTGDVTFIIRDSAPSEFVEQINLLADFAFFCGTGKKTTAGMGQTIRKGY